MSIWNKFLIDSQILSKLLYSNTIIGIRRKFNVKVFDDIFYSVFNNKLFCSCVWINYFKWCSCGKIKLFFFTIFLTVFQYLLHNYVAIKYNLNILYIIFSFPIIYMIILSGLAKITRLIKINSMGTSIKLALLLVFFQVCIKYAFVWKLAKEFGIDSKVF